MKERPSNLSSSFRPRTPEALWRLAYKQWSDDTNLFHDESSTGETIRLHREQHKDMIERTALILACQMLEEEGERETKPPSISDKLGVSTKKVYAMLQKNRDLVKRYHILTYDIPDKTSVKNTPWRESLANPDRKLRQSFSKLQELFRLNVSYDDLVRVSDLSKRKEAALIRHIFMHAYRHRVGRGMLLERIGSLFNCSTSNVLQRLRALNNKLAHEEDPFTKERLRLLCESAQYLVDGEDIPPELGEKIRLFHARNET